MDSTYIIFILAILGLFFGSFAGAQVWRLRARQLKADESQGEPVDKEEYKRLKSLMGAKVKEDRSRCLHCGHTLAWYDLIPLVSWVWLRGKCRYCRRPIGKFEPLMEIGVAVFFVASYALWPYELTSTLGIVQLAIWLIAGFGLAILFAYDAKWFLLPDVVVFPLIGIAGVSALLYVINAPDPIAAIVSVAVSWVALSGLYLFLYYISKGAWVGFGDVKLGIVLALLLANWKLALLALFLANILGTLLVIPGMLNKKLSRTSHVPFGPMLIGGWLLAGLFGYQILDWYLGGVFI